MQQLTIGAGPAGTLLVAATEDSPVPTVIQNVDPVNILYLGKEVSVNPSIPTECAPLYPGQTTIATGDVTLFGIADRGKTVAISLYEGVMSFFQPVNLNNRTLLGGYFISGSGGGTQWLAAQPSTPGFYLYYDDGVNPPVLALAISSAPGSDQWGNTWPGGQQLVGLPTLTNVFSVIDTTGATVASIDGTGNITGQTLSAANDVVVNGVSLLNDIVPEIPGGLMNYGFMAVGGTAWPSTAIGATEVPLWELDQQVIGGRVYEFVMNPTIINVSAAGASAHIRLRWTNDGSTPTTGSPIATMNASRVETAGSDAGIGPLRCLFFPTVNGIYRFLVTANVGAGTFQFKNDPFVRCQVYDWGPNTGQSANNLVVLGTGSSGGSSAQTYTEYFYGNNTWCYETNWGIQNTNGTLYQGAYQGEPSGGFRYSYIQFSTGTLGHSLNTVLNYPQVNWVKLRLLNQHSWYNSGMTVSLHSSLVLQNTGAVSNELTSWHINEGQQLAQPFSNWSAWKTANTYAVLYPPGGSLSLNYYGFFWGGGANNANVPAMIVNYTH